MSPRRPCPLLLHFVNFIVMLVDLGFFIPVFSNVLFGYMLNALCLNMNYTIEVVPLHTDCTMLDQYNILDL